MRSIYLDLKKKEKTGDSKPVLGTYIFIAAVVVHQRNLPSCSLPFLTTQQSTVGESFIPIIYDLHWIVNVEILPFLSCMEARGYFYQSLSQISMIPRLGQADSISQNLESCMDRQKAEKKTGSHSFQQHLDT